MKPPSMRSDVPAMAMPRTRGAVSVKNFSRSFTSGSVTRLKAGISPLTITGFGAPISSTSVLSPAMSPSSP